MPILFPADYNTQCMPSIYLSHIVILQLNRTDLNKWKIRSGLNTSLSVIYQPCWPLCSPCFATRVLSWLFLVLLPCTLNLYYLRLVAEHIYKADCAHTKSCQGKLNFSPWQPYLYIEIRVSWLFIRMSWACCCWDIGNFYW